jgi:hypothetical protein
LCMVPVSMLVLHRIVVLNIMVIVEYLRESAHMITS